MLNYFDLLIIVFKLITQLITKVNFVLQVNSLNIHFLSLFCWLEDNELPYLFKTSLP